MPARNRKDAAKQGKIRGFQEGDIIGVKKAGRGNTGPEWLQGTIISAVPGGFYDYEVEYVNPPAGNRFRRVCEFGGGPRVTDGPGVAIGVLICTGSGSGCIIATMRWRALTDFCVGS